MMGPLPWSLISDRPLSKRVSLGLLEQVRDSNPLSIALLAGMRFVFRLAFGVCGEGANVTSLPAQRYP
jgi:hypothetical protein